MQKRMPDKLVSLIKRNRSIYTVARYPYSKYNNLRYRREFYSRIKQLNPADYLDISSKPGLNVIMLVIDCLRGSQLSCRGYSRETTPFLDSFDSKFRAISASCWTYPAVTSLLTGLYPHNHNAIMGGKIKNFDKLENLHRLRKNVLTLPEILFLLGYRVYFGTAIGMAFYPLKGRVIPEIYDCSTRADKLLTDLTGWISKKSSPFFAYLQLGDLHIPLNPPGNFRNFFASVKDLPKIDMRDFAGPEEQQSEKFQEYKENWILLYDNALRYVDAAVEKFYATLKEIDLIDSTVLIVTADHGEEFSEHASLEAENFFHPRGFCGVGHGHNVFNEIIEVPLLIAGPAIPNRQSINLVSTVDIMPTILDLLGIKHNLKFDGQNIFQKQESDTLLLSEASGFGYEKKALIVGKFKLIHSQDDGVAWVFDLEKDPQELHPITDHGVVSIFLERLSQIYARDEKRRVKGIIEQKNLRSL
jgi:arylsulfatase A-like enzyme